MKIAVISDIHGNLEALKTTLKDIENRKVDKIICLGDIIAKGLHQKECLELVKEKCDVILRGNCDRYFSSGIEIVKDRPQKEIDSFKWHQTRITNDDREYLLKLPFCHEFYMSGSLIRMFHATPTADNEAVINMDSLDTKYSMFLPSERTSSQKIADVVLYGHIHNQFMSKAYNKTLINVGSVGNSFESVRNADKDSNIMETTRCYYLILEGDYGSKEYTSDISFQFIRLPYNIEKELEDSDEIISKEDYRIELREGKYRNMAKIYDSFKKIGIDIDKI